MRCLLRIVEKEYPRLVRAPLVHTGVRNVGSTDDGAASRAGSDDGHVLVGPEQEVRRTSVVGGMGGQADHQGDLARLADTVDRELGVTVGERRGSVGGHELPAAELGDERAQPEQQRTGDRRIVGGQEAGAPMPVGAFRRLSLGQELVVCPEWCELPVRDEVHVEGGEPAGQLVGPRLDELGTGGLVRSEPLRHGIDELGGLPADAGQVVGVAVWGAVHPQGAGQDVELVGRRIPQCRFGRSNRLGRGLRHSHATR